MAMEVLWFIVKGQGIYVDRKQIAAILNLPIHKVRVILVPNGGGLVARKISPFRDMQPYSPSF